MDNDEPVRSYDNPYNYLRSEYSRLNSKKDILKHRDLVDCFESLKDLYGDKESELFESDKILFKKLKKMESASTLPIAEQEKATFCLLNRHSENIVEIIKKNNLYVPSKIVLGTLPMNTLDALTYSFSEDEILVSLNQGLFTFLYLMGRAVSSFFKTTYSGINKRKLELNINLNVIAENLKSNTKGNSEFLEALILYFVDKNFDDSKTYFEQDKKIPISCCLWDNAECFVVAHEYGHIIAENISPKKDISRKPSDEESRLYEIVSNWNDEFEADQIALEIILQNKDEVGLGVFGNYLGVEFLFACLDIIERIDNEDSKIEFSETHPPAKSRINNLRNHLKNDYPSEADNLLSWSSPVSYILNELWDRNKDDFYKRYKLIK